MYPKNSARSTGPAQTARRLPEVPVTQPAPVITRGGIPSAAAQPARPRLSWISGLPLVARHAARTMPWLTLLAGCLAGTLYLAIMADVADTAHPLTLSTVRFALLPAVATLAFVLQDRFRPLPETTPVPVWVASVCRLLLTAPVLAATCWVQLRIMAHTIPPHTFGQPPVYPLIAQLAGWCAVTMAAAAFVDRTRYADLSGAIAAPVSLAAIALAWFAPFSHRFVAEPPATPKMTTIVWSAVAAAALALTCAAMRDRWHRYGRSRQRRSHDRRR